MLDTYFFIPADKDKYIKKMSELSSTYFVLDLEESVSPSSKKRAYENLRNLLIDSRHFCRVDFPELTKDQAKWLVGRFEGRIIIPKVRHLKDFEEFIDGLDLSTAEFIILIENPSIVMHLNDILARYKKHIKGIGFGSHDFCAEMGMRHNDEQLNPYRKQLVLLAKAHGVDYLDGVDLNIRDHQQLRAECIFAFEAGAAGKFAIHPSQLDTIASAKYLSEEELRTLKEVYHKMRSIPDEELSVIELAGKVYERPQLKQISTWMARLEKTVQPE